MWSQMILDDMSKMSGVTHVMIGGGKTPANIALRRQVHFKP